MEVLVCYLEPYEWEGPEDHRQYYCTICFDFGIQYRAFYKLHFFRRCEFISNIGIIDSISCNF
jgi:hypothetical protein